MKKQLISIAFVLTFYVGQAIVFLLCFGVIKLLYNVLTSWDCAFIIELPIVILCLLVLFAGLFSLRKFALMCITALKEK